MPGCQLCQVSHQTGSAACVQIRIALSEISYPTELKSQYGLCCKSPYNMHYSDYNLGVRVYVCALAVLWGWREECNSPLRGQGRREKWVIDQVFNQSTHQSIDKL